MRISDWSSDVCSSDLAEVAVVDDQIIDPRQFGMTQAFDNERRRGFAGACPACEARTFERVCRWKNEAFLLQPLPQCAANRFAPIGPLRSSCGKIEISGARRVGKSCVSTYRSRCSPFH